MQASPSSNQEIALSVLPYLPPLLVNELQSKADRRSPWIEAVEGSLVMADVSGFTAMTERLAQAGKEGAEWLTNIINQYFFRMLDIGRSYGGSNLRFGGDALLLFFDGDSHPARALAAANAMQQATRKFNLFRVGQFRVQLKMTAGVHSGSFYSAAAGEEGKRLVHLIVGAATNKVAKVQPAATAGELAVSPETLGMIPGLCEVEPRGEAFIVRRMVHRVNPQSPAERGAVPRSVDRLLPFLPPYWREALSKSGQLPRVEGEHRKVDVIFINLHGVNQILEEKGPQELLSEVQDYICLALDLCEQYRAFILQTDIYSDGFKLIIILGAPQAHEGDTANALRLSAELNRRWLLSKSKIYQRIGINSGYVFAGVIGPDFRRQYTVMGDAVNLSARLMSAAAANQVLVSQDTAGKAGPGFLLKELEPVRVKGKKEPVRICAVEGVQAEVPVQGGRSGGPLVGREREMGLFAQECLRTQNGEPRIVLLEGEPGIGKSRLVEAFREHLVSRGFAVFAGSFHSHTMGTPFAPFVDLLSAFLSLGTAANTADRNAKVRDAIRQSAPEFLESSPLFNSLLGLSLPETDIVASLDGQGKRRRLFEMVASLIAGRASSVNIAFILEDLHWSDQSSLELINHIAFAAPQNHFLLCLSFRPEKNLALDTPPARTSKIALSELSEQDALKIIQRTLGSNVTEDSGRAILNKAKGNPLFLEEIALALHHAGGQEGSTQDLPDRLQGLIMARLDGLEERQRELVRTASVIGGSFDLPGLRALLAANWEDAEIVRSLDQLALLDIVVRAPPSPNPIFGFRHNLMEEVAYGTLMFKRRRELHQSFGSYLESACSHDLDSKLETLAHHYEAGGNRPKTRLYAFRSGDKARRVFAMTEAANYYQKGLNATPENEAGQWPLRSYFLELIGDCRETAGRHAEASHSFRTALLQWKRSLRRARLPGRLALEIGCDLTTPEREAVLAHKIGVCCERMSKYDLSLKWLRSAQAALPARRPLQAAKLFSSRSAALFRKGLCAESIEWGKRSLSLSRRTDDRAQLANAHTILASSYLVMGNFRLALRHRSQAVRIYDELGDVPGQAASHNNLGACYQAIGDLTQALEHYRASVKASERLGNIIRVSIARNNIGEILLLQGHLAESAECFEAVIAACAPRPDAPTPAGLAMLNLARVMRRQERNKDALEQLEKSVDLLSRAGAHGFLLEAHYEQAELYSRLGRRELAEQVCERALRETRERQLKPLTARGLRAKGLLRLDHEDWAAAEISLEESIELARQINADYELALSLVALAEARRLREGGDHGRYLRSLRKAASLFQRIGAQWDLARVHRLQGIQ